MILSQCQKFVRYGVDRSCRCPKPAKWLVAGLAGSEIKYCGTHARQWRKNANYRVTQL